MAAKLSLSRAWDETRDVLHRDGRLIAIVALAMLVFPGTVQEMVTPQAPAGGPHYCFDNRVGDRTIGYAT